MVSPVGPGPVPIKPNPVSVVVTPSAKTGPVVAAPIAVQDGHTQVVVALSNEVFPAGVTVDILIEWSFDGGLTWRHRMNANGQAWDGKDHPGASVELFDRDNTGKPLPSFDDAALPTHVKTTITPHGGTATFGGTATVS
jgi:hypothetical protein